MAAVRRACVLLGAGLVFFAPSTGWGSCGDYLIAPPGHPLAKMFAGQHHSKVPPASPCQRGECKQAPLPSAPPVPVSVETGSDLWACVQKSSLDLLLLATPPLTGRQFFAESVHRSRLDRPPR